MKKLTTLCLLLTSLTLAAYSAANGYENAPLFEAKMISGNHFSLKEVIGKKPVYLKFWATWCSYCKAEMPHLQSLQREFGEDIVIVTVNVGLNDSVDNINQLYDANNYTLPTIFDGDGSITTTYGVVGTPHHVLINKNGEIAYRTFLATDKVDELITHWSKGE